MAKLLLKHIYNIYPGTGKAKKNAKGEALKRSGDFVAVKDFNMEIKDGVIQIQQNYGSVIFAHTNQPFRTFTASATVSMCMPREALTRITSP